jgi:hypothetical protein
MRSIIELWPARAALAADLGLPYTTVASWYARGRIPARYELALLRAAAARGYLLTLEDLVQARAAATPQHSAPVSVQSRPAAAQPTQWTVTLPWPERALSPNARVHYLARARAARAARSTAYWLAKGAGWPTLSRAGQLNVTIVAHPKTRKQCDDDNLIAALKPARDGLARALGVDDARFRVQPIVWGAPRTGGAVVITVEAASDTQQV